MRAVRPRGDEPIHAPYDSRVARRLLAFLRPYAGHVLLAIVLILALAAIQAAQPWVVKLAIDDHIAVGDLEGLLGAAVLYLSLLLLELGVGYVKTYLTSWIGQQAMDDLRRRLFARLQRIPVAFFDRTPVGRLVTRVTTDVEVLNELLSSGVVALVGDVFMLLAIATVMIRMDWRLALVAFLVIPPLVLVSFAFRRRMRDAYREIRRWIAAMNAFLQERVGGLAIVQLFRREEASASEFAERNWAHRDAQFRSIHHYAVFYPAVELLGALSVALVVWYGGGRILADALTFGTLVAFLQYVQKFFRPIRDVAEKYNLLQAAMASGERLIALLDEPIDDPGPPRATASLPEPAGEIVFEDVWFRYGSDRWALSGVSFRVPPGGRIALVGPTGSGKTTIASLLCRFYRPTRGRVLLDGVPLDAWPREELRRRVGLVLQDPFLFRGSVRDNVRLGAAWIDDATIEEALRAVEADAFVERLPRGLDTDVGERGRVLSTGQKQLVALGRALAFDPSVLVLDEATSSVDTETEARIEHAIERLLATRTSVVIAHRLSTIRRVDRILVVHHGEIREEGSHEELLDLDGLYARLHRLQFDTVVPEGAA